MYKFHIGHKFKNDHATIFVTQLLNDKGESVADYDLANDHLRVLPSLDSAIIFEFMNRTKREFKKWNKSAPNSLGSPALYMQKMARGKGVHP
jgi:hypothetical protein